MSKKKSLQKVTNLKSQVRSESQDLILAKKYLNEFKGRQQDTPKVIGEETENLIHKLECLYNEKARRVKDMTGEKQDYEIEKCQKDHPNLEIKNRLWEFNHLQIMSAISNFIQQSNYMPSASEIAREVKLSRHTVNKHLKEYHNNPVYLDQIEQFNFLTAQVLTGVVKCALNGDMRAAKLFMESVANQNGQATRNVGIKTQNNYLQINNTLLTEEVIKSLTPQQLQKIEKIIKF